MPTAIEWVRSHIPQQHGRLVLVTGAGTSVAVLVLAVGIVQMTGISRMVRAATLEVAVRGYVEAAVARGARLPAVLRRGILPNIVPPLLAGFVLPAQLVGVAHEGGDCDGG